MRVTSNLVVLDVTVTDADGNPIPDLKIDDFTVREDGVLQRVRTLESPASRPPVPLSPQHDANGKVNWGDAPITVIVMDQLTTPIEEIAYAREQLFKYLAAQPALLPVPTSLIVLNDSGIQTLLPSTRDRDALLEAARHAHVALPYRLKRSAQGELLLESFALLRQIALSTAGQRGRKNVLWVGRGFPSLDPQALDPHEQEAFLKAVRSTVDLLLSARVSISKIDPRSNAAAGVDGDPSDPASPSLGEIDDPFATTFSFGEFVAQTGGKNVVYFNDIAKQIEQASAQSTAFYTLSYVPSNRDQNGRYRNISVRVNRPGAFVRTKKGFYAGGPAEQPSDKALGFDMLQAAVSGMQYTGVGVRVSGEDWSAATHRLSVSARVETSSLPFLPRSDQSESTTLYVALAALDAKGKVLRFHTVSPEVLIPANQVAYLPQGHTTLSADLVLPEKTATVRMVVRDNQGRIGTADVDPAFIAGMRLKH